MKFSLSKAKYSGGGLYFSSIIALPLVTSCCYAGLIGTELKTEEDLHHFTLCLEFKSNVAYKLNQEKCASWIKEDTYKESVYNVISNAIADCALERNEFAKDKIKDGVVTFENKDYESYTAENWNAVVLYNVVNIAWDMARTEKEDEKQEIAKKLDDKYIIDNIKASCGDEYSTQIKRAWSDIKEYDRELNIIDIIKDEQIGKKIVESRVCDNYDENGLAKIKIKNNKFVYIDNKTPYEGANMNIYVKDGRIEKVDTYEKDAMYECDLDDFMNITKNKEYKYKYPRTSEGEAQAMEAIKKAQESAETIEEDVNITETATRLFDILDVGTYKDKAGKLHLAWVDVDDAYLDKAYLSTIDTKTEVTLRLGYGCDLHADKNCFKEVNLQESTEENEIFSIKIANAKGNGKHKVYIPAKDLIDSSNTITGINLEARLNDKDDIIRDLIYGSDRLNAVNLSIASEADSLVLYDLIMANEGLKTVELTVNAPGLSTMVRILNANKKLESVKIDLKRKTDKLQHVLRLFDKCYQLKKINFCATKGTKTDIIKEMDTKSTRGQGLEYVTTNEDITLYGRNINIGKLKVEFIDN